MTINPEVFERYRTVEHRIFVETGTFVGTTAIEAARRVRFDMVYTVESSREYYMKARERFSSMKEGRWIRSYHGDSAEFLREVLPGQSPAFIYLDAHFSGFGPTPPKDYVLPLWRELQELWMMADPAHPHHRSGDIIAIDDIRLCGSDEPGWRETTVQKLCEALLTINPQYRISLEPGIVPGDVMVAHFV